MLLNDGVGQRSGTSPFSGLVVSQKKRKVRSSRSSSAAVSAGVGARSFPSAQPHAAASARSAILRLTRSASELVADAELEASRRADGVARLAEVGVRLGVGVGRDEAVVAAEV